MALLSDTAIRLLFGASFPDAGAILAVRIWATVFVFIGGAQSPWAVNEGLDRLANVYTHEASTD